MRLAENRASGITRDQVNQREDERGDAKEHGNREHETSRQVRQHAVIVPAHVFPCKESEQSPAWIANCRYNLPA